MNCSTCGEEDLGGGRFCGRCGARLSPRRIRIPTRAVFAAVAAILIGIGIGRLSSRNVESLTTRDSTPQPTAASTTADADEQPAPVPTSTEVNISPAAATKRLEDLVAESRSAIPDIQGQWVLTLGIGFDGYVTPAGEPFGPVELVHLYDELTSSGALVMVVKADELIWGTPHVEGAYYLISAQGWWYPREADEWATEFGISEFDYQIIEGEL